MLIGSSVLDIWFISFIYTFFSQYTVSNKQYPVKTKQEEYSSTIKSTSINSIQTESMILIHTRFLEDTISFALKKLIKDNIFQHLTFWTHISSKSFSLPLFPRIRRNAHVVILLHERAQHKTDTHLKYKFSTWKKFWDSSYVRDDHCLPFFHYIHAWSLSQIKQTKCLFGGHEDCLLPLIYFQMQDAKPAVLTHNQELCIRKSMHATRGSPSYAKRG